MCEEALKPNPRGKSRRQGLAEMALITQIFDKILIQKGISRTLFGSTCFKQYYYFFIDLVFGIDVLGGKCNYCERKQAFFLKFLIGSGKH